MTCPPRFWITGVLVLWLAVSPLAAQSTYTARLTVENTGDAWNGLIDPEEIAIGDSFVLQFQIDPFAEQTGGDGTEAYFLGAVLGYSLEASPGNSGTFVPNIQIEETTDIIFSADPSDGTKTQALVSFVFQDGGLVKFTAEGAGIYNNGGLATFTGMIFNFTIDAPFIYQSTGATTSSYTNFLPMTPVGEAHLLFSPPDMHEGDVFAEGPAAVPEPSTWAAVAAGLGLLLMVYRRSGVTTR